MLSTQGFLQAGKRMILASLPLVALLPAASNVTPPPRARPLANTQQLEVEVIEVHDKMSIPSEIRRKPGKFILAVTIKAKI